MGSLGSKERKMQMQQETRAYLKQQMQEKQDREAMDKEQDRQYDQEALHATNVRAYCEYSEQEERRQDKIEESEFNKEMAKVRCEKRQARTQRDAEEKAKH